jgi:hypothetical protein
MILAGYQLVFWFSDRMLWYVSIVVANFKVTTLPTLIVAPTPNLHGNWMVMKKQNWMVIISYIP